MKDCDMYICHRCVDGTCPNVMWRETGGEFGEPISSCSDCELNEPSCELCFWAGPNGNCNPDEVRKFLERW